MNEELKAFYDKNQTQLENDFEIYVLEKEWGSGKDKIRITDDMFWEFVAEKLEQQKG